MATLESPSQVFPARVPPEVRSLVKAAPSMDKAFFRRLIKVSLGYLQGSRGTEQEAAVAHLCAARQATTEDKAMSVCIQYCGAVSLLKAVLRLNTATTRQEALVADLTALGGTQTGLALRLPGGFAVDVSRVVYGAARPDIDRQLVANSPSLPTMTHMTWRVDVTISTSWLSRVLEPMVVLNMKTNTGTSHTFQVPLSKFHLLRFTVASLLHQMATLQAASICKK
ncbi:COMM domain-containing protein 5 [Chionoecetes opilio]|uniref:COMM domain-containing protein 5 n=1 Tax=Chionoecetes opilio TaxID=41210 RepID=A0A8J4Y6N7_CHIOP|nr:COMM domain-containing protein 5 [Chionoecetes opilio]